jgi:hypothetical protein
MHDILLGVATLGIFYGCWIAYHVWWVGRS